MTSTLEQGQLCRRFWFTHKTGDRLYAYVKKSNRTGTLSWVVAKPGSGNNTADSEIPIFDEDDLMRWVSTQRYSVRCRTQNGARDGLYNPDGTSVRFELAHESAIA